MKKLGAIIICVVGLSFFACTGHTGVNSAPVNNASVRPLFPSEIFAPELIPYGWEVIEDVQPTKLHVEDVELECVIPLNEKEVEWYRGYKEGDVSVEVMLQRAVGFKDKLGLVDAKSMILLQLGFTTDDIFLAGTILRDSDGNRRIPRLSSDGVFWKISFSKVVDVSYYVHRLCFARSK